jgi:hypothetical protein
MRAPVRQRIRRPSRWRVATFPLQLAGFDSPRLDPARCTQDDAYGVEGRHCSGAVDLSMFVAEPMCNPPHRGQLCDSCDHRR